MDTNPNRPAVIIGGGTRDKGPRKVRPVAKITRLRGVVTEDFDPSLLEDKPVKRVPLREMVHSSCYPI